MPAVTRALVCAALLLSVNPAFADEPLRVVVPVGKPSLTAPTTASVTQELRRIPGGAAVAPAEDFQNGYALTLKDMLAATPGVLAQPRWGEEARLSIRGSGLSRGFHMRGITLLQDGVPFNFADGSTDFQELDPLTLQHIEVYRGGNALRYGGATLGGAVNAVSATARNIDHNAMVRLEGGSYETKRGHAQGGYLMGDADIFGAFTHTISNGYRQQSEQDNWRLNTNLGLRLSDSVETRFYLSRNDLNQEVPGTVSKASALNNPTAVPTVNVTGDYARDIQSTRVANRTVFDLGGAKLEAGGFYNDKQLYHPIFQVLDQDSHDIGVFSRLKTDDSLLGLNLVRGVNDAERFLNVGGNRGTLQARGIQLARNAELYGEHRLNLTQELDLIGGFQAALSLRDYTDRLNANNSARTIYRAINPKLGLMWEPDAETQIYAGINKSSEVPTFSELVQGATPGFVPVDMQTAWTAEIGTRGQRGAWAWDATIYRAHVRKEMLQYAVTTDTPASTFNADDTVHQGLELGLGYRMNEEWTLSAIYNYSDFFFRNDGQYGDNDLAGAAPHHIRLAATYKKEGLSIEPSLEWVPDAAWVDYANTLKADQYAVVNVKADYALNDATTLFVDARNLTDIRYIPSFSTITDARTAGTAVFYPGEGRSVYAGLKVAF